MKVGNWTIRSFRLAVGSRYPTPYCAVAERKARLPRKPSGWQGNE